MATKKKPELQLPARQYYRLDQAATYLRKRGASDDVDADYLLNLGVAGKLRVCVQGNEWLALRKPSDFFAKWRCEVGTDTKEEAYFFGVNGQYTGTVDDLAFAMAGYGKHPDARPVLGFFVLQAIDLLRLDMGKSVYVKACFSHKDEKTIYWFTVEKEYGLLVTADMLVIQHTDLENLINGVQSTAPIIPESQLSLVVPHGNAELNAVKRESVLKAAIACKNHYPDECANAEKWAECIDSKAQLFWPTTVEPPISRSVLVKLLREAVKLPM